MSRIRVPDAQISALEALFAMDEGTFQELAELLDSAGGPTELAAITASTAAATPTQTVVHDMVDMLKGMQASMSTMRVSVESFVGGVMKGARNQDLDVGEEKRSRERLERLLSAGNRFIYHYQAFELEQKRPNTLCTCEIVPDIRPVFSQDASSVVAAIPVYTLILRAHVTRRHGETDIEEMFVSLDCDDLENLRHLCDEALTHTSAMQKLFDGQQVRWIDNRVPE